MPIAHLKFNSKIQGIDITPIMEGDEDYDSESWARIDSRGCCRLCP